MEKKVILIPYVFFTKMLAAFILHLHSHPIIPTMHAHCTILCDLINDLTKILRPEVLLINCIGFSSFFFSKLWFDTSFARM